MSLLPSSRNQVFHANGETLSIIGVQVDGLLLTEL